MKVKTILVDIFLIFILSLTPLLWFRPGEMMVGHDNIFPLNPKTFLEGRLYTWIQNQGLGQSQSLIMGTIPIHFIDALPYLLGFSLQTTQKLVWIFWFFLIGLSAYILASLINPQGRFFKLFVTVFYQFNFFILQGWWIGERTKFSAYIALPLVLSVFLLVYQRKISILKAAILNSLILFFFNAGGLFGIPLYGGLFVSVGLFVIFFSLTSFCQKEYRLIKNLVWAVILTVVGFFLVNLYYLLPASSQLLSRYGTQLGGIGGVGGVLAWAREISVGASFANLFRLQGIAEWYDNPQHPYAKYFLTNPILILISFIFPLLIISSLVLIKAKDKAKLVLYFFLVYLTGIFFTAGTHSPFGFIYQFFVQTVPGFAIFRTPYYKFAPAVFLSGAFLCAYTLDYLKEKIGKHKILTVIFSCFWIFLILGYHFPYFTGNFFNWRENFSTRLKIPPYVFDFAHWVQNEKKDDFRVLMLPKNDPAWQYDLYKWGYLSLFPLPRLFTDQPVIVNGELLEENEKLLLDVAYNDLREGKIDSFEKITWLLRIKYLLVRKDFAYYLDWTQTDDPLYLKEIITKDFNFPLIEKFGEWELYEVDFTPMPKIIAIQKIDLAEPGDKFFLNYLSLTMDDKESYLLNGTSNIRGKEISSAVLKNYYLIPECLTCRREAKVRLVFPERVIFPDSPLYQLMILKEKMIFKKGDPKTSVYHHIGITIKRLGEIRGSFFRGRETEKELYQAHIAALEQIKTSFSLTENFPDKVRVAEDINNYLTEEQKYLRSFLGQFVSGQKEVGKLKGVISAMDSVRETISPWLFLESRPENSWYFWENTQNGSFDLLVNYENIGKFFSSGDEIKFKIDDEEEKIKTIALEEIKDGWIHLGKIDLKKGSHKMVISLPDLPNLADEATHWEAPFWDKQDNCFISRLKNYDNSKDYLLRVNYRNEFSDNLRLLIVQNETKLAKENIYKLQLIHEQSVFEEIIRPDLKTKSVSIAICAPEFSNPDVFESKKIKLEVKELTYPFPTFRLEIARALEESFAFPSVFSQQINPTKYRLEIKNAQQPFILSFWEKFDLGWKLSDFEDNHLKINGYANSWLIPKIGNYDLILEYKPQGLFYQGVIVSGLTVLGSLFYLGLTWLKRI